MRLLISLMLLTAGIIVRAMTQGVYEYIALGLFIAAWLAAGYDVLFNALRGILRGQLLDENFLMAVATAGALALGEYPEAVAVMLLYQLGEVFQRHAVGKSRRSVAALMDICPDTANLVVDGVINEVSPDEVEVGSEIVVRPGERVPLDGVVISGASALDTSALTGESLPRDVAVGDAVVSGCINISGLLHIKTTKTAGESTVTKILELVETASEKKAPAENFITKFARVYTPAVVGLAVLLCLIPTLIFGDFPSWLRRSLMLLMVSCPCALVISVPLGFFGGIGAASRKGVLIKGSNYMEVLSKADVVAFDKTGTVTHGSFAVTGLLPEPGADEDALLQIAASAESGSTHPIAAGIVAEALSRGLELLPVDSQSETAGHGVECVIDGVRVLVGGERLAQSEGIAAKSGANTVYVIKDGALLGRIALADAVKEEAKDALAELKKAGVRKTVMLTGDNESAAQTVADAIGADGYLASLLPQDKVAAVEKLINESDGSVVFVGDGINDAPVLARADAGIAMGGLGSDAAIEAADAVIMNDGLFGVVDAIRISRKTGRIVRQNIAFSIAVKFAVMLAAILIPNMSMLAAIFADVGVMILAVLNSVRTLRM